MATNLDRLFREKLDQVEVTPSAESWNLVKNQIHQKPKVWVAPMKIAAAIVLVVSAAVVVYDYSNNASGSTIANVDHPVTEPTNRLQLAEEMIAQVTEVSEESESTLRISTNQAKPAMEPTEERIQKVESVSQTFAISRLAANNIELNSFEIQRGLIGGAFQQESPSIKITYIATNDDKEDQKEGAFSKVINLAREVSSSELLADIRDAKDNLFSKN